MFPLHVCVSSQPGKDIELANNPVKCSLSGDLKPVTRSPRGKYNTSMQKRAKIGKYDADNRATNAATHFLKILDSKIGESNVSIVELSDKKLYMFSSLARCAPRIT